MSVRTSVISPLRYTIPSICELRLGVRGDDAGEPRLYVDRKSRGEDTAAAGGCHGDQHDG